jgi:hypothetical protein
MKTNIAALIFILKKSAIKGWRKKEPMKKLVSMTRESRSRRKENVKLLTRKIGERTSLITTTD